MLKTTLYTTSATATGGREGRATSDDGNLDVTLSTPKALGGAGGDGTNPEQMFAAGYAACFLSAMKFIAMQQKLALPEDAAVTATVGIGPREDIGFGLEVGLKISLPGVETAVAEKLVETAHITCPYSHATKGSLTITPELA
ncbi:organic hydroperoxide resistance protein [Shimia haliotis]|uniref:Peroxiredoxin, Ohr subfamily n=1 Tax=Shimia haliotis TaxID=1280847 RepID=A0A1I4DLR7_9RHOB|nr:organic hydroperoxide resistance protein [Shimia haliotis]SFK92851.1 peroxiredoxin, Ohr subfamily [Shimia haliotis]